MQPDALVSSANCYALIEAKRLKSSVFQPEQLAREYVAVTRDAGPRTPLLLLLLGSPPPVRVRGHERLDIAEAVALHIESVLDRTEHHGLSLTSLQQQLPETCAWITWHELAHVVADQQARYATDDPSVAGSIRRLATSITRAISWHA
ncbi:MAG: hypothetical protein ACRDQ5_16965 [Sciscionella sp.]